MWRVLGASLVLIAACDAGRSRSTDSSAPAGSGPAASARDSTNAPAHTIDAGADTFWLIAADPADDALHVSDSHATLVRRFGAANVAIDAILLGEGFTTRGTVLFPRDPVRRLEIFWRDSVGMSLPDRAIASGEQSRWVLFPGISIGTCLPAIEALNGGPFSLYGFGWDYGGTLDGWEKGRLDTLWTPRLVLLRFRPTAGAGTESEITGERTISSGHLAMRAAMPCVRELIVRPR